MTGRVLALLLAGGDSTRMGRDKATLEWHGQPLWTRQIETLRSLQPDTLAVASWNRPEWLPGDIIWLKDTHPDRGPLSGIAAALESTASDHILVLAIDMPCMISKYLHSLRVDCGPAKGIVPITPNGWEPLAAIYPAEARALTRKHLEAGKYGLQNWVSELAQERLIQPRNVLAEESELFKNVNHPTDLEGS